MPNAAALRQPQRKTMRLVVVGLGILMLVGVLMLTASLIWGGPEPASPLESISSPFKGVSFAGMPALSHFAARDGVQLAYRHYVPADATHARGSVMLVHGSSANSQSVYPLAQSFAAAGYRVYAFDMRGHGQSGTKGLVDYVGQLDDDIEDFIDAVRPGRPRTLVGFSSGGGFAMRVAGSRRQFEIDNFLFMSPYVHHTAITNRSRDSAGWASVGVPRLVALTVLNRIGVTRFNDLAVVNLAVLDNPAADLTRSYSYGLAASFQPQDDYKASIRSIAAPSEVIVGQNDEIFQADKFRQLFDDAGRQDIPVTIVPATGHIALTLSDAARRAAVAAVKRLDTATH